MQIKDFAVEQWMNAWETKCTYNVAETCVYSVTLDQLFEITGTDKAAFMEEFSSRRLTYGDIEGQPRFLEGICKLYRTVEPEHVIPTHGAAGANALVLQTLVDPGDHVVSIMPTYQQLYSIPEMCGAKVDIMHLKRENGYHVDVDELRSLVTDDTKLICINNPDNPTGALLDTKTLEAIVEVARDHDAWLMCDEVYRLLTQDGSYQESVVDLYDKGVVTSSMSKVWSLAGLRLGWCVTKSPELRRALLSHRDYNLISLHGGSRRHPRPRPLGGGRLQRAQRRHERDRDHHLEPAISTGCVTRGSDVDARTISISSEASRTSRYSAVPNVMLVTVAMRRMGFSLNARVSKGSMRSCTSLSMKS